LGAGATIGGVILLAIGLMMVVGGGGAAIMSMTNSNMSSSMFPSGLTMTIGIVFFWIGMVPTIIGVRLIAGTGRIDDLEEDVNIIKKHLEGEIKRQSIAKQDNKQDADFDKNEKS